jgi:ABC-2 type transport system permease protein
MFLGVLGGMSKYTAYSSGGASSEIINEIPNTVRALLGFGSFDVTKMSGFFAFLFLYLEVTAAIHAALLGSGIIAKEERDKTTEFLMVKPVSRATIITSKLLAALVNIVIVNIVTLFSSIVMVAAYNKGKDISGEIAMFLLSMFIVQLIFLSLGAVLAAFMRNSKASGSIAAGLVLTAYFISIITNLSDRLKFLNLLSPFKYFSYQNIINGNGLSFGIVILSILLVAAFTVSTYFFYPRRDLKV